MSKKSPAVVSTPRLETIFPVLTAAQLARIAPHGRSRQVSRGEVLVESGEHTAHLFVVIAGEIEGVRSSGAAEDLVAVFQPGMFTGEVTMPSRRRRLAPIVALAGVIAIEDGREIELARPHATIAIG